MRKLALTLALGLAAYPAAQVAAQSVKSTVTASNGVQVTVYSDEFANRYEYSAPSVDLTDGFVLVASIKKGGVATPVYLTGTLIYSGEWRRYNSALFRGGDPAKFIEAGREVGRCQASRYSRASCTLSEGFKIQITPAEISKYAQNGVLAIQIRAQDTSTVMLQIPVSYFDAVAEVSKR